jgi:hypothetical protein
MKEAQDGWNKTWWDQSLMPDLLLRAVGVALAGAAVYDAVLESEELEISAKFREVGIIRHILWGGERLGAPEPLP